MTAGTYKVTDVGALEILDSRGRPTVQVTVRLADGTTGVAGVPSGASTGSKEAVERRDKDASRYGGLGVLAAAGAVGGEIADLLRGRTWRDLPEIDAALAGLDGTPNKARLGANAIVGVSMACARALAVRRAAICGTGSPRRGWRRGCRCRNSTWSTAGCTRRTRWTSRSS